MDRLNKRYINSGLNICCGFLYRNHIRGIALSCVQGGEDGLKTIPAGENERKDEIFRNLSVSSV